MGGEAELIEISLLSGRSDRPALTFTPGTPANPVSVGTAGQWIVSADGVGPVHLYIVFDGRSVHVAAAAPGAHVLLAGAPVGPTWARASLPCELRFGGACLILRSVARGGAYAEEERTVHDGGALWQAAQRAVQDAIERAKQGPPGEAPPLANQYPAARPAAGAPVNLGATVPMGEQHAFRDALAKTTSSVPPSFNDDSPTTIRAPLVGGPLGPASPPQEVTRIAPPPTRSAPPPGLANVGIQSPVAYPSSTLQPANSPSAAPPPANTGSVAEEKPNFWQQASSVKKATLILMPFAMVMSYFMLQPEAPPPPPKVLAGAASAKRAAAGRDAGVIDGGAAATVGADAGIDLTDASTDAPSARVSDESTATVASAAPETRVEPPPKLAPLPRGARTPERQALDAVAAGSFDDAAKLYGGLAAAHPDDPSYKEAARILHEKAAQPRGNAP